MERNIIEILSLQKWGGAVPAEAYAAVEDVAKENYVAGLYKHNKLVKDFAADLLNMGYIYGQRAERERNKERKVSFPGKVTEESFYKSAIQELVYNLKSEDLKTVFSIIAALSEERG